MRRNCSPSQWNGSATYQIPFYYSKVYRLFYPLHLSFDLAGGLQSCAWRRDHIMDQTHPYWKYFQKNTYQSFVADWLVPVSHHLYLPASIGRAERSHKFCVTFHIFLAIDFIFANWKFLIEKIAHSHVPKMFPLLFDHEIKKMDISSSAISYVQIEGFILTWALGDHEAIHLFLRGVQKVFFYW